MKQKLQLLLWSYIALTIISFNHILAESRTSITQYGITWTFDHAYECGLFVSGDWWVVGPVTITSVSPNPTGTRNGSCVNPTAGKQGYDSRGGIFYTTDNVYFPYTLQPDQSLVSSVSKPDGAVTKNVGPMQSQAILTAVSSAQPAGTFRPSYAGTYKRYFNVSQVNWGLLPNLPPPNSVLGGSWVKRFTDMPRIDHLNSHLIQNACAEDNWYNGGGHPCYGQFYSAAVSKAALFVMVETDSYRDSVAINLIQYGIDNYGVIRANGRWSGNGGHHSGRKFPIVFAAKLLNDPDMLNVGDYPAANKNEGWFGENDQTYFGVHQALFGVEDHDIYCLDKNVNGTKDQRDPAGLDDACMYRQLTSPYWVGQMLATLMIDAKDIWNHDPYFDYIDRFMTNDPDYDETSENAFIDEMWALYRNNLPNTSVVSDPIINPEGGTYTGSVVVSVTSSTSGASIYYTTNGSTPTESSTLYTSPITVTSSLTIKAKAFKNGLDASSVQSATFTIQADADPPVISLVGNTTNQNQVVVVFNEAVTVASAQNASNYSLDNGAAVNSAILAADQKTVILSTSTLAPVTYTLTVNNIQDVSNNTIASNSTSTFIYINGATSTEEWQSFLVAEKTGVFTVEYDVVPNTDNMDGVIGIQSGTAAAYGDLACIVRFNSDGNFDARNGGAYASDNTISYSAGTSYHCRLEINVPNHTYDIYITPQGGFETTLGTEYAFRTEQASITSLDSWSVVALSGSHTVGNVDYSTDGTEHVISISVLPLSLDLDVDESSDLEETVLPENATDKSVLWTSSNTDVADVDQNGLVTAIAAGNAIITVTTTDGGYTASCNVVVNEVAPPAGEYYCDPVSGNMSNNGSQASPWASLEATIADGKTFEDGDVIYLKDGNHGFPIITEANTANVTITKAPGQSPVIERISFSGAAYWLLTDVEISSNGMQVPTDPPLEHPVYPIIGNSLVQISNYSAYITVDNCYLNSIDDAASWTADDWNYKAWNGVYHQETDHVTISNCHLKNVNFGLHNANGSSVSNTHYIGNVVENFTGDGLRGHGVNTVIEYNTVKNAYLTNGNHVDMIQVVGTTRGLILRGNKFFAWTDPDQPFRTGCQGIAMFDGMYYDFVIENNLVITHHYNGITLLGAQNCKVINNTVIDLTNNNLWIRIAAHKNGTPSTGNIVRNNICTAMANDANIGDVDHNIIMPYDDKDNYFTDFARYEFSLKAGAPAIDAGSASDAPSVDIDQNARPAGNGYDIGAYEYNGVFVDETSVTVSPSVLSIELGATGTLTATIEPANASNKSLTWSSNNTTVATVDALGIVTAHTAGTAVITATTNNLGLTSSCTVTVTSPTGDYNLALGKSVSVTADDGNIGANIVDNDTGDASRWSAEGYPQSATIDLGEECDITSIELYTYLSRAYQYIIEVSNDGSNYTQIVDRSSNTTSSQPITDNATATGRYIKLTVSGADVYAGTWISINELMVYGTPGGSGVINVTGVTLDQPSISLAEGATQDLDEDILPVDATDKTVTWSSSNTAVAIVDENGLVTAIAEGIATITVTTIDGGFTANCSVEVFSILQNITLNPVADAFVRGGSSYENLNFGSEISLATKLSTADAYTRETYLKFDISSVVQTVSSAVLRLYGDVVNANTQNTMYLIDDDSWTEGSITYSNKPTTGTLISSSLTPVEGAYYDIDITSLINNETDGVLSIRITGNGEEYCSYSSREGANPPHLVIENYVTVNAAPTINVVSDITIMDNAGQQTINLSGIGDGDGNTQTISVAASSSNTGVANNVSVNYTTGSTTGTLVLEPVSTGTATITITVTDNGGTLNGGIDTKVISFDVTVNPSVIHVTSVSVDPTALNLEEGETSQLEETVLPENATDPNVTWSSSNTLIATVDETSGLVTAIAEGTATIIATTNDGGYTATCDVNVSAPISSLPAPWVSADVGDVAAAGSVAYSNGTFTVVGSGWNIWNTADEFQYVYQQVDGDITITAQLTSLEEVHQWTKGGVMMRESLNAGSINGNVFVAPIASNGSKFSYRTATGETSSEFDGPDVTAPCWVRMERSGNTFTGSVSADGVTWTTLGSKTINMSSTYYVGLSVVSLSDGTLATATFENVCVAGVPQTVTLNPVADAFVRGGNYENINYGSETGLATKYSTSDSYTRETFIKFDISSISQSVTTATLRLYGDVVNAGAQNTLFLVNEDNWLEDSIRDNYKPTNITLISTSLAPVAGAYYDIDITSIVNGEADGVLSLKLTGNGEEYCSYSSREGQNTPQLVITTSGAKSRLLSKIIPANIISETVLIYPNPSTGGNCTMLVSGFAEYETVSMRVFDIAGQKVYEQRCIILDGNGCGQIELNNEYISRRGMYIVSVSTGSAIINQKLIVK